MAPPHRSKSAAFARICGLGVGALGAMFAGSMAALGPSCSPRDVVVDIPITAYVPAGCGDARGARVTYAGLGDFPQVTQAGQVVPLGAAGTTLAALPAETREVVISPLTDAGPWAGTALVPDGGPVHVLTLPLGRACPLSATVNLGSTPGTTFGMLDATHALLLGGEVPPFVLDLGTGVLTQLASPLSPSRSYATVTPLGAGALVAGGEDDLMEPQNTAVLVTPTSNVAAPDLSSLLVLPHGQRSKHAAVRLPDGRVLLVGGVAGSTLVTGIDIFTPGSPPSVSYIAATLREGRVGPTVLALPDGHVFIGGGTDVSGHPVPSVEWLDAALNWLGSETLCAASPGAQAPATFFAPTEGGSVLAVTAGPASPGCSNVQLIRPFGAPLEQAPPVTPPPSRVALFPGAQASPLLLTESTALRWNPWTAKFRAFASTASWSPPTATLSASTGLALWVGEDGKVWTLRFDTHGVYATDVEHGAYLVTDDEFTAPDRLLIHGGFNVRTGATLQGSTTVWVTDETFAAVTASVTVPVGGAATLVLRDPAGREVTCPASGLPASGTAEVVRTGGVVTATASNGSQVTCTGTLDAGARVAVGVRGEGDAGTSVVRQLSVVR